MSDQERKAPFTAMEAYMAGREDFQSAVGIVNRLVASGRCLKEKFPEAMVLALHDLWQRRIKAGQMPPEIMS